MQTALSKYASQSVTMLGLIALSLLAVQDVHGNLIRRAPESSVNASSKAGLAWANGDFNDYRQYTYTGKVSW